ncbi:MAG: hypothetical protein E6G56_11260 [Actinobacteria bacterium]|nr:MAG: hypothetical protein E6G56_11260 [Actinomycetota bacterium]
MSESEDRGRLTGEGVENGVSETEPGAAEETAAGKDNGRADAKAMPVRPDPRSRPPDPAGTQPKVDPGSLLPARRGTVDHAGAAGPTPAGEIIDADVVEGAGERLPARVPPGGKLAAGGAVETPHAPRFQFLLGMLIALGVAAIAAAAAVVAGGSGRQEESQWSAWHPSTSGSKAAQEIADHVGPEYRLPNGDELVLVNGGPLEVANLPMQVALRSDPANGGNVSVFSGKGVLYRMCGLGTKCALDQGKASTARHLLLQREALELALYSFRYIDGLSQVVVFMPPAPGKDPSEALFFRSGDLAPVIDRPLSDTLSPHTPSVDAVARSPDAPLVARITGPMAYNFSLTQANSDTSVYLVLRPLGTAG